MKYILYKHPVQLDTLTIVQYLHYCGINDIIPIYCIERNHPKWVINLPSIETNDGKKYIGIDQCIQFYEEYSKISDLTEKSNSFKKTYPDYRIN